MIQVCRKRFIRHFLPGEASRFVFLAILAGSLSRAFLLSAHNTIMKTSSYIRNILLAGTISLTLASCGGGGGGGGDSSSTGSGSGSTSENTQQEKVEIPQQLTASMSLILEINREQRQFDIKSATQCVDVANGAVYTVSYVRTGTKTATMTLTSADGTPYKIKLTLTSAKQGSFEQEDGKSGNFTMTGINSGSDNGNSGETVTPDDTPSDDELAPNSLPVGKVLEFSHQGNVIYQYEIVSEEVVIVDGKTCSAEYRKKDDNSATLVVKAGPERVWELTFLDEENGNAQYNTQGTVYDEYTFRISEKGASAPPSDGNNSVEGGHEADDKNDNEEDDFTGEGYAPDSLPVGNVLELHDYGPDDYYRHYEMVIVSEKEVRNSQDGSTYPAEYRKIGKDSATLTLIIDGVELTSELNFWDESGGVATGCMTGDFRIKPVSSDDDITDGGDDTTVSDDNITDEGDNPIDSDDNNDSASAPYDLTGYKFYYMESPGGYAFSFDSENSISYVKPNSSMMAVGNYVYTRINNQVATLNYTVVSMDGTWAWEAKTFRTVYLYFNSDGTVSFDGIIRERDDGSNITHDVHYTHTFRVEK